MKTLASLYNLYEANRKSPSIFENEAEFRSFYVLLHLGSDSQPMVYHFIPCCFHLQHCASLEVTNYISLLTGGVTLFVVPSCSFSHSQIKGNAFFPKSFKVIGNSLGG